MDRARKFYSEKLGLEPSEKGRAALLYRVGGCEFALFESAGTSPGELAQMGWEVDAKARAPPRRASPSLQPA